MQSGYIVGGEYMINISSQQRCAIFVFNFKDQKPGTLPLDYGARLLLLWSTSFYLPVQCQIISYQLS